MSGPGRRPAPPLVTLTTDFGLEGHHAGVLKGVILALCPRARIVDLTHRIPPGDVELAAWTLLWALPSFPPGATHLVVVDPGVGTRRRALAADGGGHRFTGPDNGVLALALARTGAAAVALPTPGPGEASATFHGRDVFAPAAARLALGVPLDRLGTPARRWARLAVENPRRAGPGAAAGRVVAVDRWGNLVTDLTVADLSRWGIGPEVEVRVGHRRVAGLRRTYADAGPGEPVALVNSSGHLEIAVNSGRADAALGAGRGSAVRVRHRPRGPGRAKP